MVSALVIPTPSGLRASVATVRRPNRYDLHFSRISCVNARFHPIPQSLRSVLPEKPASLTKSEEQIGVRAGPGEQQLATFSQVDHEPVGFDRSLNISSRLS